MHSYPVAIHGVIYFVQPWLGKYLEHAGWVNGIFFALVIFVMWWHRGDLVPAG